MATSWGGEGVSNNSDPLSLYRLAPVKKFWQWDLGECRLQFRKTNFLTLIRSSYPRTLPYQSLRP